MLAVYTGSVVSGLLSVASNDDGPLGGTSSAVGFRAQAGVAYQIAVDTFGGRMGSSKEQGRTIDIRSAQSNRGEV